MTLHSQLLTNHQRLAIFVPYGEYNKKSLAIVIQGQEDFFYAESNFTEE